MEDKNTKLFEDLIEEGENLLTLYGWEEGEYTKRSPRAEEYSNMLFRGMDIISKTFGIESSYYIGLNRIASDDNKSTNSYYYAYCFGIIKGAYLVYKKK